MKRDQDQNDVPTSWDCQGCQGLPRIAHSHKFGGRPGTISPPEPPEGTANTPISDSVLLNGEKIHLLFSATLLVCPLRQPAPTRVPAGGPAPSLAPCKDRCRGRVSDGGSSGTTEHTSLLHLALRARDPPPECWRQQGKPRLRAALLLTLVLGPLHGLTISPAQDDT